MKEIGFDRVSVEWVKFRPSFDGELPDLTAYGELTNDAGIRIPRNISGYEGVSPETKAGLVQFLQRLMFERAAFELDTTTDRLGVIDGYIVEAPDSTD